MGKAVQYTWLAKQVAMVTVIVLHIPAGYNVSDSKPPVSSHELKPRSNDLQTLSQEITELEIVTMVTRELVHFLGKH